MANVVFGSIYRLRCRDKTISALILVARGLRDKLFLCSGENLFIKFRDIITSDELSGLSLRLRQPILCIDDCCIEFNWKKSRFVFSVEDIDRCTKCKPLQ